MFCTSCGVEHSDSPRPKYCQNCGTRLEDAGHSEDTVTQSDPPIKLSAGIMAKCDQSKEKEYTEIPVDILKGLDAAFEGDNDSWGRVVLFLSNSIAADCAKPFIRSLEYALPNAMRFKKVAERIVEDTKTEEKDAKFRQQMDDIWNSELKDLVNKHPDGELALAIQQTLTTSNYGVATFCFLRAVSHIPPEVVRMIATQTQRVGGQIAVMGGKRVAFMLKPVVRVALVAACLSWDVAENIQRWWNGEITGKRCVKNIIACGVGVAAGINGGWAGQAAGGYIGSFLGPVGTACGMVVGGVVGGILASITAETLSHLLTESFFGLPKSEALENAYSFFGISSNTSNGDVKSLYRHLALQYHPDKGGDPKMWAKLQYSLAIIMEARR